MTYKKKVIKFKEKTKKEACKKLLKYISDPSRFDLQNIAEDVGCCERTVYRALKELRGDRSIESKYVKTIKELEDSMKTLYNFMNKKMQPVEQPTKSEIETIERIEEKFVVK